MTQPAPDPEVIRQLARWYRRNGYARPPAAKRRVNQGYGRFRRGFEFRLTAGSRRELAEMRALLRRAGFHSGRPFIKGRQYRQPVYGRADLERFLKLIGEPWA